jgi:hypothetical protein
MPTFFIAIAVAFVPSLLRIGLDPDPPVTTIRMKRLVTEFRGDSVS